MVSLIPYQFVEVHQHLPSSEGTRADNQPFRKESTAASSRAHSEATTGTHVSEQQSEYLGPVIQESAHKDTELQEMERTSEVIISATDPIEDRDCRNKRSRFATAKTRPPCHLHPTGTLKYQWHDAYEHLLLGTGNRMKTYVVLLGYESRQKYNIIAKFVTEYFDNNRDIFLEADFNEPEGQAAFERIRTALMDYVAKERGEPLWHMQEDGTYVALALEVFIKDSHHTWATRPGQIRGTPGFMRYTGRKGAVRNLSKPVGEEENEAGRRWTQDDDFSNIFDTQTPRVFYNIIASKKDQRDHTPLAAPPKGSTLLSPIVVDAEDDAMDLSYARETAEDAVRPKRTTRKAKRPTTSIEALANPNYYIAPAGLDMTNLPALQEAFYRVQYEKHQAAMTNVRLNDSFAELQIRCAAAEAYGSQARADAAALGLALAERCKIRRNSKAAVINTMPAQTNLHRDVTERLMENPEFTRKWLPGYFEEAG
ncbi:hypothetical protein LTS08_008163 [Lithohypha guttulata]|nr:hypothetical protein LTS08_008163 [Lithohypha guttulata]